MAVDINGQYIPTANTKLLLHMEGNSNDSSGNGYNGTDTAMKYEQVVPTRSMYAVFNGLNSKIDTGQKFNYLPITVSLWFKQLYTDIHGQENMLIGNYYGSSVNGWAIHAYEGNYTIWYWGSGSRNIGNRWTTPATKSPSDTWNNLIMTVSSTNGKLYLNGVLLDTWTWVGAPLVTSSAYNCVIDAYQYSTTSYYKDKIDEVIIENIEWTAQNVLDYYNSTQQFYPNPKSKYVAGKPAGQGTLPKNNDSSVNPDLVAWKKFQTMLMKSVNGGTIFSKEVVSTYSLAFTTTAMELFGGGILDLNGNIHFVPKSAVVGQKISSIGIISTYSLVYTHGYGYFGGVLSPNGDIHFVPLVATVGQKVSLLGVVSTYSLVYTNVGGGYIGGILAPNGDIHFVPQLASVGQKVSYAGVVSTYSLVYTNGSGAYAGGVLAPNGDIHFAPCQAPVGQKISSTGVVSTYSLIYTNSTGAYYGSGVLSPSGDIHFIPASAPVGQKVSSIGIVSTYSLVYTNGNFAYGGGVLSPNGDIYFIPFFASVGQKVSYAGVVTTYSLVYAVTTVAKYEGGVLLPNGDIYFINRYASVGQKISTFPAIPFPQAVCQSPFLNKL